MSDGSKAEIAKFFAMMADRSEAGEFRTFICATIGEDNGVRISTGGMATIDEFDVLLQCIETEVTLDVDEVMPEVLH